MPLVFTPYRLELDMKNKHLFDYRNRVVRMREKCGEASLLLLYEQVMAKIDDVRLRLLELELELGGVGTDIKLAKRVLEEYDMVELKELVERYEEECGY